LLLRWHQQVILGIYRAGFTLAVFLYVVLLFPVWVLTTKRRKTLLKRLGWQDYPQAVHSPHKPVWIHALSVGEVLSAGSLIEQVRRALGDRPLYLSVSTLSAYAIATERFSRFCDGLFYFPYDVVFAVTRCLNQVEPALFVLVETDIWPGFLSELRRRQIPCLLVNGRLSRESFRAYRFLRVLFEPAFNTFRWVYPQSSGEADRFLALGLEPVRLRSTGNLKFDVALTIPGEDALVALRQELNIPSESRVVIAGSTHPGEEEMIRSVFLRLREEFPHLRLILVPRRPERGAEVLNLFRNDGVEASLLSKPTGSTPVVVVIDRMGYLSRLYALADIAVVGGSFVPKGGQNPIEPAACGKPILFGLDMHDFPDVSRWLSDAGGAVQVRNEQELYAECRRLLADPQQARMVGDRARRIVTDNQGTTVKIVRDIMSVAQGVPLPS
jgi:3-deoxy-D-manno-octulosonic-acid transferase